MQFWRNFFQCIPSCNDLFWVYKKVGSSVVHQRLVNTCLLLFLSLPCHFWLIHFYHLYLLHQPCVGFCQATCVQSHQRQPRSPVAKATYEVQISTADSLTVPTATNGVSKSLCCRLTLIFTLTSANLSLYITLLLYWSLYNYAAHAFEIMTPSYCRASCR